uniref:Phosphoribosyltransferase domain-containing protein n=1 Tax=Ciona savignyi TaxID=51511 RepID=H2YNC4_CIOSA
MQQASNILLLCHSTTEELAQKILPNHPNIEQKKGVSWKKFPDGFPNLFIEDVESCIGKHVVFLGSFHSPEVIFEQISLVYALPRSCIKSLTFILPYFPTGTMERIDTEGQVATASTMARMLSAIPLSAMGPAQIMIFDIHVLQERFFFTDNVLPRLQTALPRFLQELHKFRAENGDVKIAFPDEGAHKRFQNHFDDFSIIRCIKKRNGSARKVSIVDGSPSNCHVVIVDDLIMTGGTVLECASMMLKSGATSVSAYVTHAVFPLNSWRNFLTDGKYWKVALSNFWITDSLPHATEIAKHRPFELLSLAESICRSLQK